MLGLISAVRRFWVRLARSQRTSKREPRYVCPALEGLEARWAPATNSWIGPAGGLWSNNLNWTEGRPPNATDDVDMGGLNDSTMNGNYTVKSLTLRGVYANKTLTLQGSLACTTTITLSAGEIEGGVLQINTGGTFNWGNGTRTGAAASSDDRTVIQSGATLNFVGFGNPVIDGGGIYNYGTVNWNQDGPSEFFNLYLNNGAMIHNLTGAGGGGGVFKVRSGDYVTITTTDQGELPNPVFTVEAGCRLEVEGGSLTIGVDFTSVGTLNVEDSTLILSGQLVSVAGAAVLNSGSSLRFSQTGASQHTHSLNGLTQTGLGGVSFIGSSANKTLGLNGVNILSTFGLSELGGLVGDGTMTISSGGKFIFGGGYIGNGLAGTGRLHISENAELRILQVGMGLTVSINDGFRLINDGTVIWYNGTLNFGGSLPVGWPTQEHVIVNNGIFDIRGDYTLTCDYSTNETSFANHGTVKKSAGPGQARVEMELDNFGTVQVTTGTLVFVNVTF